MANPENPTLVIEFDPQTAQVKVSGPINNRMISYAMLKMAEKSIDEHYEREKKKQEASGILPVRDNGQSELSNLLRRKP